jgi:hypothetical protein
VVRSSSLALVLLALLTGLAPSLARRRRRFVTS